MTQTRLKFGKPWSAQEVLGRCDKSPKPIYTTELGVLFQGDCLTVLPNIKDETVDTIFADPPFNLGKEYGGSVNDERPDHEYLEWSYRWIDECIRVLQPGGAFFLYNLPRWNIPLGTYLMQKGLLFRNWIAINIKFSLPIPKRIYPSHYSLLYYTKGKAKTFRSIRTPIEVCRHCGKEIKDYGGHRDAMNPKGVNLTDVWNDIPPVRHWKFKSKKRKTNQLSTKLIRRCLELSSRPGDLVLDPFGGSGTTYDVCEHTGRHWIGMEVEKESCEIIVERLENGDLHHHAVVDHVEEDEKDSDYIEE
jgi:site-specific DNA-methyltransferase (adenine-specific)